MAEGDILIAVLGGVLCLFGFTLYMAGLRVLGLILGGGLGALIAAIVNALTDLDQTTSLVLFIGLVVVGAGIGFYFIKVAHRFLILLIGGGLGFALARSVLADFGGMWAEPWVPIVAVVVGAVLFSVLFRYAIILITVFAGAHLLYQATGRTWVWLVAAGVGFLVQIGAFQRLGLGRRARG